MLSLKMAVLAGAACLAASSLSAQQLPGDALFAERCAVCHGASGAGDGIVGELFAQRPKDLRILARENGGTFPYDLAAAAIDGRAKVAAHGNSQMPIWGEALMDEALVERGINPKDARMVTDARVHSLVAYIQSLQVD